MSTRSLGSAGEESAALYLEQNGLWDTPARFDVLEITGQGVCYLPNAFDFE